MRADVEQPPRVLPPVIELLTASHCVSVRCASDPAPCVEIDATHLGAAAGLRDVELGGLLPMLR